MRPELTLSDLNRIVIENNRDGKSEPELVNMLRDRGWPAPAAERFVHNTIQANTAASSEPNTAAEDDNVEELITDEDIGLGSLLLRVAALAGVGMVLLHLIAQLLN